MLSSSSVPSPLLPRGVKIALRQALCHPLLGGRKPMILWDEVRVYPIAVNMAWNSKVRVNKI